jgi:hypothetical protein
MRLKITAKYPKKEVKELVDLAYDFVFKGKNVQPFDEYQVWVKNCSHSFAGRIYLGEGKIVLRIGKASKFPRPYQYPNRKTAPAHHYNDWQEALYGLAVHEFWHWIQWKLKSPISEVETEVRVVAALEIFRANRESYNQKVKTWETRAEQKHQIRKQKAALKDTPEFELQELAKKMAKIQRRLKLYQTKMKKLSRRQRFLQKKISSQASPDVGGQNEQILDHSNNG